MCIEENVNIYDYGYMVRNNAYQYWIGGFYGKDNFGSLTQGKIYRTKEHAISVKNKIKKLYDIYVCVVEVRVDDYGEVVD